MQFLTFWVLLLLSLTLTLAGCTDRKPTNTPTVSAQPAQVHPAELGKVIGPQVDIVKDPIFASAIHEFENGNSYYAEEVLLYSEGWKKVLADADAQASSLSSDEVRRQVRAEAIAKANKSDFYPEAMANIKRLRLAYLQQHPESVFVLGYYSQWLENRMETDCDTGVHLEEKPYSCIPALRLLYLRVTVSPADMDKAVTQILTSHGAEYEQAQAQQRQYVANNGLPYDADEVSEAKKSLWRKYIAFAVSGDFHAELVDNRPLMPDNLKKQTRRAYLIDNTNGAILARLENPEISGSEKSK